MAMKVRLKFDGHCPKHPRYSPERDGAPVQVKGFECYGCDDLWVIYMYSKVVAKRIENNRNLTTDKVGVVIPGYVSGMGEIRPQQIVMEKDIDKTVKEIQDAKAVPVVTKPIVTEATTAITTKGAVERVQRRKKERV